MLPPSTAVYETAEFQQFYTDTEEIKSLMQNLLGSVAGLKVLEPSAGRGAFLFGLVGKPSIVDAVEIDERQIDYLKACGLSRLNPIHADFIDMFVLGGLVSANPLRTDYDALISNPPYGLHFSIPYRKQIKRLYPHLYARESYGLFMYFGIQALRKHGRYVFIVPDTFLTSKNHTPLREFIISQGRPTHIIRFPSKRFETVNFGYGHLCVIAGYREHLDEHHKVLWVDTVAPEIPISTELFLDSEHVPAGFFTQHLSEGWVHPAKRAAIAMKVPSTQLGQVADCKTGIYTGDNLRFCGFDKNNPPGRASNGHEIDWQRQFNKEELSEGERKEGISGSRCYVPFIRGGHRSHSRIASSTFAKVWPFRWSRLEGFQHHSWNRLFSIRASSAFFLAIRIGLNFCLSISIVNSSLAP
jgi:adenine-specific DNA-methyltransferase